MSRTHQLNTPFSYGAGSLRFRFSPDLIYDDGLRHVVFHSLNHDFVLQVRGGYLHASGLPMAGWGMSPSPAISLLVSTITTRRSSEIMRAASRNSVVLPTPGRPSKSTFRPSVIRSRTMSTVPETALPTRQVSPTTSPVRLRMAEMRCKVRSIPARLSVPKWPSFFTVCDRSSAVISHLFQLHIK